jgi:hypothetical protein
MIKSRRMRMGHVAGMWRKATCIGGWGDVDMWTGLVWLRIGTGGELL